ncbi:hypothetical protein SAMD00024442_1_38 [Candidatus Symbiothrix dinenymphae]|nr:hypothetical protein SAMD00024442_1_38 [Candidatus Symbiothrix dinenymphae]
MKKMMLLAFVCLGGWSVMAQGSGSVNNSRATSAEPQVASQPPQFGQTTVLAIPQRPTYLPEAGSFSIGISANPFLDYLGNLFSSYGSSAPNLEGLAFGAKYFLRDEHAIRANLKFSFDSNTDENAVDGIDGLGALTGSKVTDTRSSSNLDVELRVGYELHKGKGRVDGFYGAEVLFGYASGSATYEYGNATLSPMGGTPITDWNSVTERRLDSRPLEDKVGASLKVGVGAFVGIEYFFAPQFSIGGEVGLEFAYTSIGQRETKTQSIDIVTGGPVTGTTHSGVKSSNMGVHTNPNGHLFVSFYF